MTFPRWLLPFAVSALFAAACGLSCSVNFVDKGLPHCQQDCKMWCWATSLSVIRSWYYHNTSGCSRDECGMAGVQAGRDCCSPTPTCEGPCGEGSTNEEILRFARFTMPHVPWNLTDAPAEPRLIDLLNRGHPIVRLVQVPSGGGHADVVAGCRENSGDVEYLVVDSADKRLAWMPYNYLIQPSPAVPNLLWRKSIQASV